MHMKKIVGTFALGVSTVLAVQKVLNHKQKQTEEKLNPKNLEGFLDPFFEAIEDSWEFKQLFEQIITEKMTIEDVELLKQWFEAREETFSFGNTSMAYGHLIRMIDQHLPVQGSLKQKNAYDQTIVSVNHADL